MNVSECMSSEVVTIDRDASLVEASHRMLDADIGFLPVVEGGRLIGIITDRDLVTRGLAENLSPTSTFVQDLMSIEIVCCSPDESLEAAKARMLEHEVRRMPVIDHEGRLLGMISRRQLGLEEPARKTAVEVSFRKTKTDSYGRQHKVPIRTIYVTGSQQPESAIEKAVELYEREQGTSWNSVADDVGVKKIGPKADDK
jgi:CBS domain-containing protein